MPALVMQCTECPAVAVNLAEYVHCSNANVFTDAELTSLGTDVPNLANHAVCYISLFHD